MSSRCIGCFALILHLAEVKFFATINGIEFGDSYLELVSFKARGGPKRFTFDRV
jgi:hypothetical protein